MQAVLVAAHKEELHALLRAEKHTTEEPQQAQCSATASSSSVPFSKRLEEDCLTKAALLTLHIVSLGGARQCGIPSHIMKHLSGLPRSSNGGDR